MVDPNIAFRSIAVGLRALINVAREQLGADATAEAVAERVLRWRIAASNDLEARPWVEEERIFTEKAARLVLRHVGGKSVCICGKCPTEPAPPQSSEETVH